MHNTHTLNRQDRDRGFTLLEMSIAMMIVALLLAPALGLYFRYVEFQRTEQTHDALSTAQNEIGGFRSIYGRYPCPADPDLAPGDADYGYEKCAGGGITVATSLNGALVNQNILIGSLPFRQLNMMEEESLDGNSNRLTYAVTESLTDSGTFDMGNGGISVEDANGNSLVSPDHSAHLVILSHGEEGDGAITRVGQVSGGACPATPLENENCDNDETFVVSSKMADFDDLGVYTTSNTTSAWQYSAAPGSQDIHLRAQDMVALGLDNDTIDPDTAIAEAEVQTPAGSLNDGIIWAEGGAILSDKLCDATNTDCFDHNIVGGNNTSAIAGSGMYCGAGLFAYNISNSTIDCTAEVWFSCPEDQYMVGFNSSGEMICDEEPDPPCDPATVTNSCGDSVSLPATASSAWRVAYAGECHMIDSLDTTYLDSLGASSTDINTYVDTINDTTRTSSDCESVNGSSPTVLIRDSWQCQAGTWSATPNTHETGGYRPVFPTWLSKTTGSYSAETYGPAYNAGDPMSVDTSNGDGTHDCWCREDYRTYPVGCPDGYTGTFLRIDKHRCPQTYSSWTEDLWNNLDAACDCSPGTYNETESCNSYYGVGSGLTGDVIKTFEITCPSGPSGAPYFNPTPIAENTAACTCPSRSTQISTDACPTGYTNSFSYDGNSYTDVARVYYNEWGCPPPTPGPINPATGADAGSWTGDTLVHTEACTCDSGVTKNATKACEPGYDGTGYVYEVEYDCVLDDWEPESDWTLISSDCTQCQWTKPSGSPELKDTAVGSKIGNSGCSCGDIGLCYESAGGGKYNVYSGCSCTAY